MENDKKECRAYFLERSVYKKLFAKIQAATAMRMSKRSSDFFMMSDASYSNGLARP